MTSISFIQTWRILMKWWGCWLNDSTKLELSYVNILLIPIFQHLLPASPRYTASEESSSECCRHYVFLWCLQRETILILVRTSAILDAGVRERNSAFGCRGWLKNNTGPRFLWRAGVKSLCYVYRDIIAQKELDRMFSISSNFLKESFNITKHQILVTDFWEVVRREKKVLCIP